VDLLLPEELHEVADGALVFDVLTDLDADVLRLGPETELVHRDYR
jgi:hypothetical protein